MSGAQLQIPATVRGLNGRGLSPTPPSDGQLLRYNASTQLWEPHTPGPVMGVTDGSDAGPGEVGEIISATVATTGVLAGATWANTPSINLTPGDWELTGWGMFVPSGAASATYIGYFSAPTTTGNNSIGPLATRFYQSVIQSMLALAATIRVNTSSPMTIYLGTLCNISWQATNPFLQARRMR